MGAFLQHFVANSTERIFVGGENYDRIEVCICWNVLSLSAIQLRNYELYNG